MWDFKCKEKYTFRQFYIPSYMMHALERYVEHHEAPGQFLTAVITNDLHKAISYADEENTENLPAYVGFFYNQTPGPCWGSQEKFKSWIKDK